MAKHHATHKGDPTKYRGVSRLNEAALRAKAKHYRRLMWKTPILTPKRVEYEKLANGFARAADQAHIAATSPLFKQGKPEKLWSKPNNQRLVDVIGIINTPTGIQSDAINAIAAGAQAGPGFLDGEMRKTILGALMALKQTGCPTHAGINLHNYSAPMVDVTGAANKALAKAIGAPGKSLTDAYHHAVREIARYGPHMRAVAWANREMLWLADVAGFEAVHGMAAAVVSLFTPIGTVVGAAIGAHSAITLAITSALSSAAAQTLHDNLRGAKAEMRRVHPDAGPGAQVPGGSPLRWLLVGGGVLVAGGAAYAVAHRRK